MPFPTIGALAQRLYDQVAQAQDPADDAAAGWPLASICGALLDPAQFVADALDEDDTHPPGGKLLDPDETPDGAIAWLAQFAGVRPTKGASEATRRGEVRTAAGWKRGWRDAMIADVHRTLTGSTAVTLTDFYTGNRWRLLVVTYAAETPDPAATERAAQQQKPYGIVGYDGTTDLVRVDAGWSIGQMEAFHAADDIADLEAAYDDLDELETVIPEV
jgi:hypothetical protein